MAERGILPQIVRHVKMLIDQHGFRAFRDRDNTEHYLRRHFPSAPEDTDACLAVLYLPRYLDCLEWLRFDPESRRLAVQYWAYYNAQIAGSGEDVERRQEINRLFLIE